MATLPPRKTASTKAVSASKPSAMQILLQMGFPRQRAEKALSATGNRGIQPAADWLLAHVNDPTLDSDTPREYVLYLCPVGNLFDQLQTFWTSSLLRCGRNGAHNQLPHVTLCTFFKAPDDAVPHLAKALRHIVEQFQHQLPEKLTLDLYTSTNFLGLFVADNETDVLKNLAVQFIREAGKFNVTAEPAMKALHLTLAYQFPTEHYNVLNELASAVDTNAIAGWELRLYSREARLNGNEVHRVIYSHVPQETDELELLIGDFVYVNPDQLSNSPDGWVEGTSLRSGVSGLLPKNYIEHTPESDAWTLHRSILLTRGPILDETDGGLAARRLLALMKPDVDHLRPRLSPGGTPASSGHHISPTAAGSDLNSGGRSPEGSGQARSDETRMSIYENVDVVNLKPSSKTKVEAIVDPKKLRQLVVVRHGERVDFTFGAWIPFCFDEKGTYIRKDLNMPKSVPPRRGGPQDFYKDSPLTEIGLFQALKTGEAMREHGLNIDHVYCSPSFRCVQTCTNILKGLDRQTLPIRVEPGLFEWLAWYQDSQPVWMSVQELRDVGFNVDATYRPLMSVEELHDSHETSEQYYMRSYYVSQNVLKSTADKGGNILLVGHAATLDTCTRQMCGAKPRSAAELSRFVHKIPYCSVSLAEESVANGAPWNLIAPPFPGFMHSGNIRYDWKVLLS